MTRTPEEYKQLLKQQLSFIQRSALAYDDGQHDEAVRIALNLRVILHDTKNCKSLLTQLNAKDIKLASKTSDDSSILAKYTNAKAFAKVSMVNIGIGYCEPILSPPHRFVDVSTWWTECIISSPPHTFARKDVILCVADKDGGAHIDATLPADYQHLKSEGALGRLEFGGQLQGIADAPYMLLRTMASEVLASPDLGNLVT